VTDEVEELYQPTLDDVRYLLALLDKTQLLATERQTIEARISETLQQLSQLKIEIKEMETELTPAVRDLNLDALSTELMGITDPIGQLASWLSDQLKGLASWFSSIVQGIVNVLWSSLIKPALDAINYIVSGIRDKLASVGDAVAGIVGQISSVLSKVSEVASAVGGIVNSIISSVSSIISGLKDFISSSLSGVISSVNQVIGSISSGLKAAVDALARLPDTVKSIVSGFADTIIRSVSSALAGIGDTVKGILSGFVSTLTDLFGKLGTAVSGLADQVVKGFGTLGTMLSGVLDTLKSLWSAVESAVKGVAESIGKALATLADQVLGALKSLASVVSDFFSKIGASISSVADYVAKGFTGLADAVSKGLGDLWGRIQTAIAAVTDAVSKAITPIVDMVSRGFEELGKWMAEAGKALQQVGVVIMGFTNAILQLPSMISGFFKWISEAIEGVRKALENFFKDPIGTLKKALEDVGKWVWNALPDWLKNAITAIQNFFDGLAKGLQDFIKDPLGFIQRGFAWLAEQIWKLLPDWLKGAIEAIQGFFAWLWDELQKFAKDPLGYVYNMFKWLGEEIWKRLPEPLKWIIENVQKALASAWDTVVKFFTQDLPGFFAWLWEGVQSFIKDPLGWFQRNVGEPLWNLAKWLWDRIVEGLQWLWEQLQKAGAAIWNALVDVASTIWNAVGGALQQLALAARDVAQAIMDAAFDAIAKAFVAVAGLAEKALVKIVAEWAKSLQDDPAYAGLGEVTWMFSVPVAIVPTLAQAYAVPSAISAMSYTVEYFDTSGEAKGQPMGIGMAIAVRLRTAIIKALKEFGDTVKDAVKDLMVGFWMGFFVAMWDTLKFLSRASWKKTFRQAGLGDLPIEMPSTKELIEMIRRLEIEEQIDRLKKLLMYYGYPDWYIEYLTKLEKDLNIQVTDRFGQARTIPLSPIYDMPTLTDISEMMVKDVFASFDDYLRWAERLGMAKDVAKLFYFLRFRYPAPRDLWTFTARALAGLAWYAPTQADLAEAVKEAGVLGAYAPKTPTDLNFDATTLFSALSTYMKWHDYARFAWISGFTSDNYLVIDSLAEIPGRIDVRWMARYGLLDFAASKGIGLTTPASGFTAIVEGTPQNPTLQMDLTLMSRLLQATGLHPYYVPIVTVSEAIQAFTDERSLLRGGITDLYEKGLADLDTLDDLMSNLSVLTFKVAYFDMSTMDWKEGYINAPLVFLPAERKLIAMRAVINRYAGIFNKAVSEIINGVRSLVLKPEDAKERITKFGSGIANVINETTKALIGREVTFKIDDAYLDAWLNYAQQLAELETAERLRIFISRVGGWLLYRIAAGYVSDEELARVINTLQSLFYMTDTEAKALLALATAMRDIAKREPTPGETLPSLSTLATMAEYIEVPADYIQRILAERRVEATYAQLWLKYIAARTISSEVNTLTTTYRRIVEYFGLPETLEKQIKELMRAGGWTEREIQIFDLDLYLRRAYRVLSTLIPTLRQFVGDALYLGEWENLFNDLMKARGLDVEKYKAQVEYYKKLIKARKLWRRFNTFITELINCYARGVIEEEDMRKELEPLKTFGLDDDEIEIIVKTAQYRRARYEASS